MKFCDNCGSYMKETSSGFKCPRCGKLAPLESDSRQRQESRKHGRSSDVYVVDRSLDHTARVAESCPRCGNQEAFRWVSSISGEHAGIRRERTVEHFKCTKCLHTWVKTS